MSSSKMKRSHRLSLRTVVSGLISLATSAMAQDGLVAKYCSDENTGSGEAPFYSIYQSMGSCSGHCRGGFAFAIVQGKNCWCSNYIPPDQASTSECDSKCPGFPDDLCGNPDQGLYGYIELDRAPLGTAGASTSTSSTTSTVSISHFISNCFFSTSQ